MRRKGQSDKRAKAEWNRAIELGRRQIGGRLATKRMETGVRAIPGPGRKPGQIDIMVKCRAVGRLNDGGRQSSVD